MLTMQEDSRAVCYWMRLQGDNMNPYTILGGVLLLIAVAFGGYHKGHSIGAAEVQTKWDANKIARSEANNKAIVDAVAKNNLEHEADLIKTAKVITNYETALDTKNAQIATARRDADAKRLRITVDQSAVCARPSEAAETAGAKSVDGTGTAAIDLPREIEQGLRDLAEDDDKAIALRDEKLAGLRAWIKEHGFYGPAGE